MLPSCCDRASSLRLAYSLSWQLWARLAHNLKLFTCWNHFNQASIIWFTCSIIFYEISSTPTLYPEFWALHNARKSSYRPLRKSVHLLPLRHEFRAIPKLRAFARSSVICEKLYDWILRCLRVYWGTLHVLTQQWRYYNSVAQAYYYLDLSRQLGERSLSLPSP